MLRHPPSIFGYSLHAILAFNADLFGPAILKVQRTSYLVAADDCEASRRQRRSAANGFQRAGCDVTVDRVCVIEECGLGVCKGVLGLSRTELLQGIRWLTCFER